MSKKRVTLNDIASAIEGVQASVSRLERKIDRNEKRLESVEIAVADNNLMIGDMRRSITNLEVSVDDLGSSMVDMGNMVTDQIKRSENRVRADIRIEMDGKLDNLSKEFQGFRKDVSLVNYGDRAQVLRLTTFAKKVSAKTGIQLK